MKYKTFPLSKCIWKFRLRHGNHFVQGRCIHSLALLRRQAITWINADLLIEPPGTKLGKWNLDRNRKLFIHHLKMSTAKWRPFCSGSWVNSLTPLGDLWRVADLLTYEKLCIGSANGLVPPVTEPLPSRNLISLSTSPWPSWLPVKSSKILVARVRQV